MVDQRIRSHSATLHASRSYNDDGNLLAPPSSCKRATSYNCFDTLQPIIVKNPWPSASNIVEGTTAAIVRGRSTISTARGRSLSEGAPIIRTVGAVTHPGSPTPWHKPLPVHRISLNPEAAPATNVARHTSPPAVLLSSLQQPSASTSAPPAPTPAPTLIQPTKLDGWDSNRVRPRSLSEGAVVRPRRLSQLPTKYCPTGWEKIDMASSKTIVPGVSADTRSMDLSPRYDEKGQQNWLHQEFKVYTGSPDAVDYYRLEDFAICRQPGTKTEPGIASHCVWQKIPAGDGVLGEATNDPIPPSRTPAPGIQLSSLHSTGGQRCVRSLSLGCTPLYTGPVPLPSRPIISTINSPTLSPTSPPLNPVPNTLKTPSEFSYSSTTLRSPVQWPAGTTITTTTTTMDYPELSQGRVLPSSTQVTQNWGATLRVAPEVPSRVSYQSTVQPMAWKPMEPPMTLRYEKKAVSGEHHHQLYGRPVQEGAIATTTTTTTPAVMMDYPVLPQGVVLPAEVPPRAAPQGRPQPMAWKHVEPPVAYQFEQKAVSGEHHHQLYGRPVQEGAIATTTTTTTTPAIMMDYPVLPQGVVLPAEVPPRAAPQGRPQPMAWKHVEPPVAYQFEQEAVSGERQPTFVRPMQEDGMQWVPIRLEDHYDAPNNPTGWHTEVMPTFPNSDNQRLSLIPINVDSSTFTSSEAWSLTPEGHMSQSQGRSPSPEVTPTPPAPKRPHRVHWDVVDPSLTFPPDLKRENNDLRYPNNEISQSEGKVKLVPISLDYTTITPPSALPTAPSIAPPTALPNVPPLIPQDAPAPTTDPDRLKSCLMSLIDPSSSSIWSNTMKDYLVRSNGLDLSTEVPTMAPNQNELATNHWGQAELWTPFQAQHKNTAKGMGGSHLQQWGNSFLCSTPSDGSNDPSSSPDGPTTLSPPDDPPQSEVTTRFHQLPDYLLPRNCSIDPVPPSPAERWTPKHPSIEGAPPPHFSNYSEAQSCSNASPLHPSNDSPAQDGILIYPTEVLLRRFSNPEPPPFRAVPAIRPNASTLRDGMPPPNDDAPRTIEQECQTDYEPPHLTAKEVRARSPFIDDAPLDTPQNTLSSPVHLSHYHPRTQPFMFTADYSAYQPPSIQGTQTSSPEEPSTTHSAPSIQTIEMKISDSIPPSTAPGPNDQAPSPVMRPLTVPRSTAFLATASPGTLETPCESRIPPARCPSPADPTPPVSQESILLQAGRIPQRHWVRSPNRQGSPIPSEVGSRTAGSSVRQRSSSQTRPSASSLYQPTVSSISRVNACKQQKEELRKTGRSYSPMRMGCTTAYVRAPKPKQPATFSPSLSRYRGPTAEVPTPSNTYLSRTFNTDFGEEPQPRNAAPPSPEQVQSLKQNIKMLKADRDRALQMKESLKAQLEDKDRFCQQIVSMGLQRISENVDAPAKESRQMKAAITSELRAFKESVVGHLDRLHQQSDDLLRHVRVIEDNVLSDDENASPKQLKQRVIHKVVTVEKVVQQPVEVERIIEKIVPVPKVVQQLVEVERIVEKVVPVERIVEMPVPVERIVERLVEVPVEKVVEIEKVVTVPVEKIVEVPVIQETVVHRVVEVPVERTIEVPVEKIVEVPVEVEKIVERFVEVERFVTPEVDEEARRKNEMLKQRVSQMLAEVNGSGPTTNVSPNAQKNFRHP